MRLICPNCGAQYEVDSKVIPDAGRDVQCSGCGHTWFQRAESTFGVDDDMAFESVVEDSPAQNGNNDVPDARNPDARNPDARNPGEADHQPEIDPEDDGARKAGADEQDSSDQNNGAGTATASQLDESILGILRQEAETEIAARNHDDASLETQTDLGLEGGGGHANADVQERTARLRGIEPTQTAAPGETRGDLLPDIEEINSTLRATSDRATANVTAAFSVPAPAHNRSGFRLGFGFVLVVLALAILAYVYAPLIVEKLPQTRPWLVDYVEQVNSLRVWIDGLMKQGTALMTSLMAVGPTGAN